MVAKLKIAEIARQTGVSVSSVSRVLAGKSNTSAAIRKLVLECAEDKGVLANLSQGRFLFNYLTVFAPSRAFGLRSDIYYYKIAQSIREAAEPQEVYINYCAIEETASDVALFLKKINDPRCDAAILLGIDDPRVHEIAADIDKSVALINCVDKEMRLDAVLPDHRAIGQLAARYLITRGHRDILLLMCGRRNTMMQRLEGVRDVFEEFQVPFNEERVITSAGFSAEESEELVTNYLNQGGKNNLPSAILSWGDFMASGAFVALEKAGIFVPADISIMSMDGQNLADTTNLELTAIKIPRDELGQEALQLIQRRRMRPDFPCSTLLLGGKLLERESVKKRGERKISESAKSRKYGVYGA